MISVTTIITMGYIGPRKKPMNAKATALPGIEFVNQTTNSSANAMAELRVSDESTAQKTQANETDYT
jgi:hypothetical protein